MAVPTEAEVTAPAVADRDATLQANLDTLVRVGEAIGGWSTKTDVRQTGVSLHLKFENKVDLFVAMEFAQLLQVAPGALGNALRLLLGQEQVVE